MNRHRHTKKINKLIACCRKQTHEQTHGQEQTHEQPHGQIHEQTHDKRVDKHMERQTTITLTAYCHTQTNSHMDRPMDKQQTNTWTDRQTL